MGVEKSPVVTNVGTHLQRSPGRKEIVDSSSRKEEGGRKEKNQQEEDSDGRTWHHGKCSAQV